MKFLGVSIIFLISFSQHVFGQIPYQVLTLSESYTPLTTTVSVNGNTVWDEDTFTVAMPFSYKIGNISLQALKLDLLNGSIVTSFGNNITGLSYGDMDLADKGRLFSMPSKSPIRYNVSGVAPNRIFKLEISNAGFYKELNDFGTSNDSVNIQIWVKETTNIIEFHYGSSNISHSNYFFFGNGPAIGVFKNYNIDNETVDYYYVLKGNPGSPTIDSLNFVNHTGASLNNYPPTGTVYRFVPTGAMGITLETSRNLECRIFPTITNTNLNIELPVAKLCEFEILDAFGRKILSGSIQDEINTIDISSLVSGNYLIKLTNQSGYKSSAFIKQ